MTRTTRTKAELASLARYLATRRQSILRNWQHSVALDPELATSSGLSRAQFNDHIPEVLDAFERRLRAREPAEKDAACREQQLGAAEHGLHRWQQGYNQRQTIREWGHLHACILKEIEAYERVHTGLQPSVMPIARQALVRLCGEGVCASAARYDELQRTEAASRVRDLENALRHLRDLDRQRTAIWREAAHDLRGTVGVISNASTLLIRQAGIDPVRAGASRILERSVRSLRELLTDLMDLARLEAGHEHCHVAPFDAAEYLRKFCDNVRPLAIQRQLFLEGEGPPSLPVEGDAVKVLRIAQNLVLNALNATRYGGVRVLWGESVVAGSPHWWLTVQDTGPGFQGRSVSAPLERELQEATREAREVSARDPDNDTADAAPMQVLESRSPPSAAPVPAGEGIGLSIVKRLCELLHASLELETSPGAGTTFRVTFPGVYGTRPAP